MYVAAKPGKETFGLIIGTRAYFNSALAIDVRKTLCEELEKAGYGYVILDVAETLTDGAMETVEDGRKCAKLFREYRDQIDGIIVSLPNFGFEVGIINAINLIDGIDGLASGLSAVACLYYGVIFYHLHQFTYSLIAFVALGVIVPFFYYNVFGNAAKQKKIFMGDTGSLTIGIVLSLLSIKLLTIPVSGVMWSYNPLVVAFAPLMVPCLDVIRVFTHRIRNGRDPFMPDKNHIHHKLLGIGLNPRLTMITIVTVSLLLSLLNLYASQYINIHILLLLNFAIYGAIIGGVIRGNESFIAVGDTHIQAYDRVAVFALPQAVKEVDKFFK